MSKKVPRSDLVPATAIQDMVHVLRGQRVMLDFDLARLYGLPTLALKSSRPAERRSVPGRFCLSTYAA